MNLNHFDLTAHHQALHSQRYLHQEREFLNHHLKKYLRDHPNHLNRHLTESPHHQAIRHQASLNHRKIGHRPPQTSLLIIRHQARVHYPMTNHHLEIVHCLSFPVQHLPLL